MLPIHDDNPSELRPYATLLLIAANAFTWLQLQGLGTEPALSASVCALGLIPAEVLGAVPSGTRVDLGPGVSCQLGGVSSGLTVISSMFMHGGWMHLLGNLWFLWIFGNNVEDSMGHLRFLVFYLLSGVAAGALHVWLSPESVLPMVGASGAIGGVMGAYVWMYPRVRVHLLFWFGFYVTTIAVPAVLMLGYWFALQLIGGAVSLGASGAGVAFWAHVGGFVAGVVTIPLFRRREYVRRHPYYGWSPRHNPARAFERRRGRW